MSPLTYLIVLPIFVAQLAQAQNPAKETPKELPLAKTSSSKGIVSFPETKESEIAIQTGVDTFEVLGFMIEQDHAFARSCAHEAKKRCKAEDMKDMLSKTQREISDRCNELKGESRIARKFAVKRISSVCYFKEDKSFVEIY